MPKKTLQRVLDTRRTTTTDGSGLVYAGVTPGGGGGISDHGLLTGLGDDDHAHYHNDTRGDARYVPLARTVTGSGALGGGGALSANQAITLNTPGTLTAATTNSSTTNHTHAITSSSNPGAAASILQSTSGGLLTLVGLTTTTSLTTPLINGSTINVTPSGSLILDPATLVFDPSGNNVQPQNNYDVNLGTLNKKWLTLHAAELWVETLVAQETIATIGGRILVGPTTSLIADVGTGDTTIDVKHNEIASGDRVYMEASGKVEFMAVTSGASAITGGYRYSVTRNLDGTGANVWYAGDAVFNTGTTSDGFIDIYSVRGVKAATEYGPAIVGNIRLSDTYNDWAPRWAIGNLNGLYDYVTTRYGFAAGNPATTWIAADASNGLRIMNGSTTRLQLNSTGNLKINDSTGANVIALDSDGTSYFAGPMTLGTGGGIYQGTGTFASPTTGLKIWRDSGVGRIAGYNGGVLQWGGDTNGKFKFGADTATIDAVGLTFSAVDTGVSPSVLWKNGSGESVLQVYSQMVTNSPHDDSYVSRIGSYMLNSDLSLPGIGVSVEDVGGMISFESINSGSDWTGHLAIKAGKVGSGTAKIYLAADSLSLTGNVSLATGYTISVPYGSVSAPSYSFNTDSNTGFYNTTDNVIGVAAGGINIAKFAATYVQVTDTADNNIAKFRPGSFTLAADATASLPDTMALIIAHNSSDGTSALYWIRGGANAAVEVSDPSAAFSITKDTDNQINIYYDSGTTGYTIQNTYAATKTIHLFMFGLSSSF